VCVCVCEYWHILI